MNTVLCEDQKLQIKLRFVDGLKTNRQTNIWRDLKQYDQDHFICGAQNLHTMLFKYYTKQF